MVSSVTDFNKQKKLDVDSVSGTPTVDKATPIIVTNGTESTTGNGDIQIDFTNVADAQDIAIFDQNDNLLDYEIENPGDINGGSTSTAIVIWCYNSWVRDGTTQAKVVYGANSDNTDNSVSVETVWDQDPADNRWSANEASGNGTLFDSTSNNVDGTVTGATQGVAAEFYRGIDFDGTDDLVDMNTGLVDGITAFYASAWVNVDSFGGNTDNHGTSDSIMQESGFGSNGLPSGNDIFGFGFNSSGGVHLYLDDGSGKTQFDTTATLNTGSWYHVVARWDGSTVKLYIDGTEELSTSYSPSSLDSSAADFHLGCGYDTSGGLLDGTADEMHLRTGSSLSADHIQAEYDASPKAGQVFFSQAAAESTAVTENANATITSAAASPLTATTSSTTNALSVVTSASATELTAAATATADALATITTATVTTLTAPTSSTTSADAKITSGSATPLAATTSSTANTDATITSITASSLTATANAGSIDADATITSGSVTPLTVESVSITIQASPATASASPLTATGTSTANADASLTSITASPLAAIAENVIDAAATITTGTVTTLEATASAIQDAAATITSAAASPLQAIATFNLGLTRPFKALITTPDTYAVMEDKTFKEGDLAEDLEATLKDANGAIDLTNAQGVTLVVQDRDGTTNTYTMSIESAANGTVKYDWQSGDIIDTPGVYLAEYKVDWGSGIGDQTIPNEDYVQIEIEEDLE